MRIDLIFLIAAGRFYRLASPGVKIYAFQLVICLTFFACSGTRELCAQQSAPADSDGNVSVGKLKSAGTVGEATVVEKKENDFHIRVKAPLLEIKNSFYFFCRDRDREFRNLLGIRGSDWSIPIRIEVMGEETDVVKGKYLATQARIAPDNGMGITVFVKLNDQFDEREFTRELIKALLLEQMLATFKKSIDQIADKRITVPDWMIFGTAQLISHKRQGRPSAFFSGYIKSGQLLSVKQIFEQKQPDRLDPFSQAAYEASSTALVDALLTQKDGKKNLREMIRDLAASTPDQAESLIRQNFPALREVDNGLEKWWALQIATMGKRQALEFFDPEKTDRLLGEVLKVSFNSVEKLPVAKKKGNLLSFMERIRLKRAKPGGDEKNKDNPPAKDEGFTGTLDQFTLYRNQPDMKEVLLQKEVELQRLKAQGFPLYRPLLNRYELALGRILKGQWKGLEEEFSALAKMRESIRKTMETTKDYINFYEAARAPEKSHAFDDYTRVRRALEKSAFPRRNDGISNYLDQLEKEFR